jgi:hypothetical protein
MVARLHSVADKDIHAIVEQPLRIHILHSGEIYDDSLLEGLIESEKAEVLLWKPIQQKKTFYLEAAFQSVTYLLTEEIDSTKGKFPLNFITGKRLALGEIGWGEANFYYSTDVKEIAKALNGLNLEVIKSRYNSDFFNSNKIYPGHNWTESDIDELLIILNNLTKYINGIEIEELGIYITIE